MLLSSFFAAPGWLRDLGVMSWLLVGVFSFFECQNGLWSFQPDTPSQGGPPRFCSRE